MRLLFLLLLTSCGPSSNLLGLLTPHDQKESFPSLLALAAAAYDRGDLASAFKYSNEAWTLDPDSEEASVLYGYVNLSLAGTDPFELAKGILANEKSKVTPTDGTQGASSGTSDELGALKAVIGVTPAELGVMGTLDNSDPTLPLLIPKCAEDVRGAVKKLTYVDQAIRAICPFIDPGAHVSGDPRQACALHQGTRTQRPRAHFLWAFAHLTEALVFDAVLTYATVDPTGKTSNLELRVKKIQSLNTTSAGIGPLLAAVQSLNATLQAVLPTSGQCSPSAPTTELKATLNDMLAVDAAFDVVPGAPAKIREALQSAMARIKTPQTAGGNSQATAFKGDFTKGISKSLAAKIDALGSDPSHPLQGDQKTALCSSYAAIAAGSGQASALCATP